MLKLFKTHTKIFDGDFHLDTSFAEHVRKLNLGGKHQTQFMIISSAIALAACGGGGGGGSGGGGRNRIEVSPMQAQAYLGTARADIFTADIQDFPTSPLAGFSIDGLNEIDELLLQGTGTVNAGSYNSVIDSIEIINTSGGGKIEFTAISAADVTALSDLSTRSILTVNNAELLIMQGDQNEVVALGSGWTLLTGTSDNGILQYGGVDYNLFSNGTAIIAIAEGRSVTINGMATANGQVTIDRSDDNIIFGGDGNDELTGGSGDDFIYGGNGNDTLTSGDGFNHVFAGGAGADIFYFNSGSTGTMNDVVLDFERGIDRLAITSPPSRAEVARDTLAAFRLDPRFNQFSDSEINQLSNQIYNQVYVVSPSDYLEDLFDAGVYTASISSGHTVFGGTDTVTALEFGVVVGSSYAPTLTVTLRGQTITTSETLLTFADVNETIIIPTEEFSNLSDLQTGGITFDEVITALGGDSAFIYI